MPDAASERIDQLVLRHLDGALDDNERAELMAALRSSATARQALSELAWQHTALPVILDAAGVSARTQVQPIPFVRRMRPWLIAASIAMALLLPVLLWQAGAGDHQVRLLADQAGERWLRSGERIIVPTGGARMVWSGEATELVLLPGTVVNIEQLGPDKVLQLESGLISAEVATQTEGRSLTVHTPNGTVKVVGTRFTLSAETVSTRLSVTRGAVSFTHAKREESVIVKAGFTLLSGENDPGLPTPLTNASPSEREPVVIDQALFNADGGVGWRGYAVDGGIAAVPDGTSEIVLAPERLGQRYGVVRDTTIFTLRCSVTTKTTLAIIVVCQDVVSREWRLNLISDRPLSPGLQDVSWTFADLKGVGGADSSRAIGCRIGWIGVMTWEPAQAGLIVHRLEIKSSERKAP